MFCPRCGETSDDQARFCASCGARLPAPGGEGADGDDQPAEASGLRAGLRAGLRRVSGRTRRERLLTGGTALAVVLAVAAFIALPTDDDERERPPLDPYTREADRICVGAKQDLLAAGRRSARTQSGSGTRALAGYARAAAAITERTRSRLGSLDPPRDRRAAAAQLDAAMRAFAGGARELARTARAPGDASITSPLTEFQQLGGRVQAGIEATGLPRCSAIAVVGTP